MKKYAAKLQTLLRTVIGFSVRHYLLLILIFFGGLASYLVVSIGNLSRLEPSAEQLSSVLQEVKKTNTDIENIKKLQELEGRNISIESLFDNGRINPFEN